VVYILTSLSLFFQTFNTQFSMHKLTKLICALTEPQKRLIDQCGFGSILKLKCRNMPYKQLIVWLARYYDEKTQCIKIPGTRAFKIDALTVHCILGIPRGRAKILQELLGRSSLLLLMIQLQDR